MTTDFYSGKINPKFNVMYSERFYPDKETTYAAISNDNPKLLIQAFGNKRCMRFNLVETTIEDLYENLTNGRTICNVFNVPEDMKTYSDEFGMKSKCKKNINFKSTNIVFVDVDNTSYTLTEFLDILKENSLTPTLYYTTYSNLKPGKGWRFRLLYVLDEPITNFVYAKEFLSVFHEHIITLTGCKVDGCGKVPAQYFNGTCKTNPALAETFYGDFDRTLNTYSLEKLSKFFDEKYYSNCVNLSDPNYAEKVWKDIQEGEKKYDLYSDLNELDLTIEEKQYIVFTRFMVKDMDEMSKEEYYDKEKGRRTRLLFRNVKIDKDVKYIKRPEGYFRMTWIDYPITDERGIFLWKNMMIRRAVFADVTWRELIYNAWFEVNVLNFIDNEDGKYDAKRLARMAARVMKLSKRDAYKVVQKDIEVLIEQFSDVKIIFNYRIKAADRNKLRKEFFDQSITELYDTELSVKENYITKFNKELDLPFACSTKRLYDWCKEHNVKTNPEKIQFLKEIEEYYCEDVSLDENIKMLKEVGITISKATLWRKLEEIKILHNPELAPEKKPRKQYTRKPKEKKVRENAYELPDRDLEMEAYADSVAAIATANLFGVANWAKYTGPDPDEYWSKEDELKRKELNENWIQAVINEDNEKAKELFNEWGRIYGKELEKANEKLAAWTRATKLKKTTIVVLKTEEVVNNNMENNNVNTPEIGVSQVSVVYDMENNNNVNFSTNDQLAKEVENSLQNAQNGVVYEEKKKSKKVTDNIIPPCNFLRGVNTKFGLGGDHKNLSLGKPKNMDVQFPENKKGKIKEVA